MKLASLFIRGAALLAVTAAGCRSPGPIGDPSAFEKPSVAVESFVNRAPVFSQWRLGEGMASQLSAMLVKSDRVSVVSREALAAVMGELAMQDDPRFRPEGRVAKGRLKNAQYLIRGEVTDFSQVAGGGVYALRGLVSGSTRSEVAMVSIVVSVINVESREVLSRTFSAKAYAAAGSLETEYKGVAFGGDAFYRTPLGEATQEAIWDAVNWIVDNIASEAWAPRVARIEEGVVYVTGGLDRGMKAGDEWEVWEPGEPIRDPATGDTIGRGKERVFGRVRVDEVQARMSLAKAVAGQGFRVGQRLRKTGAR
ncbi:MAG TPA: CsgG/HfaB family protein [Candidatus Brocadiia bacterium]|nr:CsgG/HfaB family protein [Candidatus Brocadiia bacterium]